MSNPVFILSVCLVWFRDVTIFFFHVDRNAYAATRTLAVVAIVGAPEEEITHCRSACFSHTFAFFLSLSFIFLEVTSCVNCTHHIEMTKSTTVVLVYEYIPLFSTKVYTVFSRVVFSPPCDLFV